MQIPAAHLLIIVNVKWPHTVHVVAHALFLCSCVSVSVWLDRLVALRPDSVHGRPAARISVWRSRVRSVKPTNRIHCVRVPMLMLIVAWETDVNMWRCLRSYGKRAVLLVSVCVHAFCGLVPAVLPQPFVFLAIRCLTGVCCCCINICSFTLGNCVSKCRWVWRVFFKAKPVSQTWDWPI